MKTTISNIAWQKEFDLEMYSFLQNNKIEGIEIAPTRIFEENPYEDLKKVKIYKDTLQENFKLKVVSMQSICFGRNEAIFSSNQERIALQKYIETAIDFASILGCENLVFGSPKNRIIGENQMPIAIEYFKLLGDYANSKNTVFAFEPNPIIYGTNFINTTEEAFELIKKCNSKGLKVNFDLGTFIYNNEDLISLDKNINLVNHVHISEPYLEKIKITGLHKELADVLRRNNFTKNISIEIKQGLEILEIQDLILQIQDVFKN
ncbi:sugar phosphate isomerase/epimerase family protein [Flavobacterium croceum]|uniref:sugar phosphate isomerase/epimerase family protein n=1 Tax=Flavobacterium croceum TaxID=370975 RepID=UPI0024A8BC26|nr:TIM barrel protein [Flavobacterium croceum]